MYRTRPVLMQFYEVKFGAVTFVLTKAIFRETRAEVAHNRVARDLGDHARGGNGQAVTIAVDDRGLRQREGEYGQAVDQDVLGLNGEAGKSGRVGLWGWGPACGRVC